MNVIELVREAGFTPKKQSGRKGGEWASGCPLCGSGQDRFRIFPEQGDGGTWWCRVCDKGGDLIQFLRDVKGLSYGDACRAVGREASRTYRPLSPSRVRAARSKFRTHTNPAGKWREKAIAFVDWSHARLLEDEKVLAYLAGRGITLEAVKRFRLGWNPGEKGKALFRPRESWGLQPEKNERTGKAKRLWLPTGIVIPFFRGEELHRIRIRREGDLEFGPRYYIVPGSGMAPMVINPEAKAFVTVEAELDGILCAESAPAGVGAIALGTLSGKPDEPLHEVLTGSIKILNALDFEEPEELSSADPREMDKVRRKVEQQAKLRDWWQETYPQAERWPVPAGKDPGDAFRAGVDIGLWIQAGLPPVFQMPEEPKPAPRSFEESPVPQVIYRLHELMRQNPIWIRKKSEGGSGCYGFEEPWDWNPPNRKEVLSEASALVFDAEIFKWLRNHPDEIIDARNLFRGGHES